MRIVRAMDTITVCAGCGNEMDEPTFLDHGGACAFAELIVLDVIGEVVGHLRPSLVA